MYHQSQTTEQANSPRCARWCIPFYSSSNFWNTSAIDEIFDGVYTDMIDIHVRGPFPNLHWLPCFNGLDNG